ncbi:uncharacterized protein LOC62_02G001795 [Vanrija pseudolonga]|uniref:Uncharacterized protein n=1 Tax=Vanrija pseudolonga TaxID=143232 RepID=A0AAF0Y1B2_9TREE|nr:hypothetical protein LOC62_02G001795 [Vanrija pseudolonga]
MVSLSALRKGKGKVVSPSSNTPTTSSSRRDPTWLPPINETAKSPAHTASRWPHGAGALDSAGGEVLDHPDASHLLVVGPREALSWSRQPLAALAGVTSAPSAFRSEPAPTIISQRGDRPVAEVPLPYRIDDVASSLCGAGVIEAFGVEFVRSTTVISIDNAPSSELLGVLRLRVRDLHMDEMSPTHLAEILARAQPRILRMLGIPGPHLALCNVDNLQRRQFLAVREQPLPAAEQRLLLSALEHSTSVTHVWGRTHPRCDMCDGKTPARTARLPDVECAEHLVLDGWDVGWDEATRTGNRYQWFVTMRCVAILQRNKRLHAMVAAAAFRVLVFARLALGRTAVEGGPAKPRGIRRWSLGSKSKREARPPNVTLRGRVVPLPRSVLLRIAEHLGDVLTAAQVHKLVEHAADRGASRAVWRSLRGHTGRAQLDLRDEWLYNGGLVWELGYAAARARLSDAQWPRDTRPEAWMRALAFAPAPEGCPDEWRYIAQALS